MNEQQKTEILETVGKRGAIKERRLFWQAKNGEIKMAFAQEYLQYRQKYIERVRVGAYADYGMTEADIVLVEHLPPLTNEN
ncbi:hypothetical protein [Simonsiella muelleri]|uniref:hypothetical protein n=1 Tax=Simonsiella muelleri TaxID=72 RepID=UPI0023F06930|nr:hypothetical protein [Simonsiella muelleri]